MFRLTLLLLAGSVCSLGSVSGRTSRAITYQAYTDQALSRPASRGPSVSSGSHPARLSPGPQPPTASSNALWNHRGAVTFPLLEIKNLVEEESQTKPTTLNPFSNEKNKRHPKLPRQEANEPHSTTTSLPISFWPLSGQNFDKNEENAKDVRQDYPNRYHPDPPIADRLGLVERQRPVTDHPIPVRLGSVEGRRPITMPPSHEHIPEHSTEQLPPAPLPTQDLFNWLRSLLPSLIAEELFSAPCRISRRSDPPPNEPLLLLEEVTGTRWRFPRTAQELGVRLMQLVYRTHDDQWGLIKLLARDAVDHQLWEFVTEEEVERVGGFLSRGIVDQLNRLGSSVRRWVPLLPLLDAQKLMPQPRVTRRFDAGCRPPRAETSLAKILGAKAVSMALHALADRGNVSDGVLRYERRSVDDRLCQLTILGFGLDGAPGLCRDVETESQHPRSQQPRHRRKRNILRSFHPFSIIVNAWNNFETDHYPIYDTLTRVMHPVLLTLPILVVVLVVVGKAFSAHVEHSIDDPVQRKVDLLEDLTETVLPAIERQATDFGDDVGGAPNQPLEAPDQRLKSPQDTNTATADNVGEAVEDVLDGVAVSGISPRLGDLAKDGEQEVFTQDAVQTEKTLLTFADESGPPQAESTKHSDQSIQEQLSEPDSSRLGDHTVQNPDEREESDEVLDLVRAILAGSDATQEGDGSLPFFPLNLRIQRNTAAR